MPDPVPWLRAGTGETPQHGGCIMQVVDWIERGEWTDRPPGVHPVIQSIAIKTNDALADHDRQRLLDLAPRMMNTAGSDERLAVQLAVFCAEWVLPIFEGRFPDDGRPRAAIAAAQKWLRAELCADAAAAAAARFAAAAYAAAAAAAADGASAADAAGAAVDAADADAAVYAAAAAAARLAAGAYAAAADAAAAAARFAAGACAAAGGFTAGANAVSTLDLLTAVLDEYDRLTSRTTAIRLDCRERHPRRAALKLLASD